MRQSPLRTSSIHDATSRTALHRGWAPATWALFNLWDANSRAPSQPGVTIAGRCWFQPTLAPPVTSPYEFPCPRQCGTMSVAWRMRRWGPRRSLATVRQPVSDVDLSGIYTVLYSMWLKFVICFFPFSWFIRSGLVPQYAFVWLKYLLCTSAQKYLIKQNVETIAILCSKIIIGIKKLLHLDDFAKKKIWNMDDKWCSIHVLCISLTFFIILSIFKISYVYYERSLLTSCLLKMD